MYCVQAYGHTTGLVIDTVHDHRRREGTDHRIMYIWYSRWKIMVMIFVDYSITVQVSINYDESQ